MYASNFGTLLGLTAGVVASLPWLYNNCGAPAYFARRKAGARAAAPWQAHDLACPAALPGLAAAAALQPTGRRPPQVFNAVSEGNTRLSAAELSRLVEREALQADLETDLRGTGASPTVLGAWRGNAGVRRSAHGRAGRVRSRAGFLQRAGPKGAGKTIAVMKACTLVGAKVGKGGSVRAPSCLGPPSASPNAQP
jgi:hypothetical protein